MYVRAFVQLGFLQKCLNWIYDHILSPLFDFMTSLFNTLFSTLFNYVLLPLLEMQYKFAIQLTITLLENFIYDLLYRITKILLWVLDAVEKTFRLFGGLLPVYTQSNGTYVESGSFLLTIFRNNYIVAALFGMIGASFVLCFLVSLIATAKSIFDMEEDDRKRRTASKVLRLTANALLRMLLIPVMALFMITLGDAVLKSIDMATNPSQASVSNVIFTMGTLDAVRTKDFSDAAYYNSTTRASALAGASQQVINSTSDFGLTDKYRKPFYEGTKLNNGTLMRDDITVVLKTFDIRRIDYVITIGGAILFIYIFGMMAVSMVMRAFDCILLLLVEPFFAAYMPLDDGEHFKTWQDTFIGRLVSCYGMVVAINVYLGVIELIFSNKVSFFGPGTTPGVVYLVNLIFVLVGAYAIIQAGPIITGIMSENAASRELEGIQSGQKLTTAAMSAASYPFRRVAGYLFNKAVGAASDGVAELLDSTKSGAPAKPGQGDAFGKPGSSSQGQGSQFTGKKPGGDAPSANVPASGTASTSKTPATTPKKGAAFAGAKPTGAQPAGVQGTDTTIIETTEEAPKTGAAATAKKPARPKAKPVTASIKAEPIESLDSIAETAATAQQKDKKPAQSKAKKTGDKASGDKALKAAIGAQILEDIANAPLDGQQQGFDPNQPQKGQMDYSFLAAGNTDAMNHDYVWVGQEAQKEEKKKKEMDELLKAEIDEAALLAAESGTGLDLNGDGAVTGTKSDKAMSMHDIVSGDSVSDVDLFAENPLEADITKAKTIDGVNLTGKAGKDKPISMKEIVGGEAVSNVDLFADSPIETGNTGSPVSGTDFTSSTLSGSELIKDENALFGTIDSNTLNDFTNTSESTMNDIFGSSSQMTMNDIAGSSSDMTMSDIAGSSSDMSINEIVGSESDLTMKNIFASEVNKANDDVFGEKQDPIKKNVIEDDDL